MPVLEPVAIWNGTRCGTSVTSAAIQGEGSAAAQSAKTAPAKAVAHNFFVRMVQYKTNALRLELDSTPSVINRLHDY